MPDPQGKTLRVCIVACLQDLWSGTNIMNEAIDYNALDWVRLELGKVLKQACSFLEE